MPGVQPPHQPVEGHRGEGKDRDSSPYQSVKDCDCNSSPPILLCKTSSPCLTFKFKLSFKQKLYNAYLVKVLL